IRIGFVLASFVCLLFAPSIGLADGRRPTTQKPKAPKPPPKPKSTVKKPPKPKTTPSHAVHTTSHNVHTAPSAAHAALRRSAGHYYAGKTHRSWTWYRHHQHRHWMYEVRVRSRAWATRGFATPQAAKTFMVYLRHHHFQRYMRHSNSLWV